MRCQSSKSTKSPSRMVDPRVGPREGFVTSHVNVRPRLAIAVPTRLFPPPLALLHNPVYPVHPVT